MPTFKQRLIAGMNRAAKRAGYTLIPHEIGINFYDDVRTILGGDPRVIFDVGANVGQTARRYAGYFPTARIHSFEPFPESYQKLAQTAAKFGDRVIAHPFGLGETTQTQTMYIAPKSVMNSMLPPAADAQTAWKDQVRETSVEIQRLDAFVAANAIPHIDLLKIDTEGFEMQVLRGAGDLLAPATIRMVLVEIQFGSVYEGQTNVSALLDFMAGHGYRLVDLYDKFRKTDPALLHCNILFA